MQYEENLNLTKCLLKISTKSRLKMARLNSYKTAYILYSADCFLTANTYLTLGADKTYKNKILKPF